MPRVLTACLALMLPLVCLAAKDPGLEEARPGCTSQNQGRLWPEAANHDSKVLARFMRCGELFICMRGTWHYHWESPSVRVDQLGRGAKLKAAKPSVCEEESAVNAPPAGVEATSVSR